MRAFRSDDEEINRVQLLTHHLQVLRDYSSGQIGQEQIEESIVFFAWRYQVREIAKALLGIVVIENERSRCLQFHLRRHQLLKHLEKWHRREFAEAVELLRQRPETRI